MADFLILYDPVFLTSVAVAFLSFILGLAVFLGGRKNRVNQSFFIFTLMVVFWTASVTVRFHAVDPEVILWSARLSFLFATLLLFTLYYFSTIFPFRTNNISRLEIKFWSYAALLVSSVSLTPYLISEIQIVEGVQTDFYSYGYYFGFIIYFVVLTLIIFKNFIVKRIQTQEKIVRQQIDCVLYGVALSVFFAFSTNVLIPLFTQITLVASMGPVAVIFFIGLTTVAILRYSLFSLKIVATQIFVLLLIFFNFSRMVISETASELLINGLLFVFVSVIGMYLIRSVLKEVQTREKMEVLARDLSSANKRLNKLNMLKTEFVSLATHQLRSPLTAVKGYASMILDGTYGEVDKKIEEPISRILSSSTTLTKIVQDFLDVSTIEQGSMKYTMKAFSIKELINEILGEIAPNIEISKIRFLAHIKEDPLNGVEYLTFGDRDKLKQVFLNIIDNAFKYTKKGTINLNLSYDGKHIILSLKDTGIGIDPSTLPQLFHKFERAEGADEVNVHGTGLGLYLARQIVEAHGGKIRVMSEGIGEGSTFVVFLKKKGI